MTSQMPPLLPPIEQDAKLQFPELVVWGSPERPSRSSHSCSQLTLSQLRRYEANPKMTFVVTRDDDWSAQVKQQIYLVGKIAFLDEFRKCRHWNLCLLFKPKSENCDLFTKK